MTKLDKLLRLQVQCRRGSHSACHAYQKEIARMKRMKETYKKRREEKYWRDF